MILADTSVWIDFFRNPVSHQSVLLAQVIRSGDIVIGDLILVEILQGLKTTAQERQATAAFAQLETFTLCGPEIAPVAAENYRTLRRAGATVRGTINVIIAT